MSHPDIVPGDPVPDDALMTLRDGQMSIALSDGREMLVKKLKPSEATFERPPGWYAVRYLAPEECAVTVDEASRLAGHGAASVAEQYLAHAPVSIPAVTGHRTPRHPAPWRWRWRASDFALVDANNEIVVDHADLVVPGDWDEHGVGAVIAAAPELRDALRWALGVIRSAHEHDGEEWKRVGVGAKWAEANTLLARLPKADGRG